MNRVCGWVVEITIFFQWSPLLTEIIGRICSTDLWESIVLLVVNREQTMALYWKLKLYIYSFSGVQCYDTVEGAQCGPCPTGYEGDGKSCRRQDICNESPCAPGESDTHNPQPVLPNTEKLFPTLPKDSVNDQTSCRNESDRALTSGVCRFVSVYSSSSSAQGWLVKRKHEHHVRTHVLHTSGTQWFQNYTSNSMLTTALLHDISTGMALTVLKPWPDNNHLSHNTTNLHAFNRTFITSHTTTHVFLRESN